MPAYERHVKGKGKERESDEPPPTDGDKKRVGGGGGGAKQDSYKFMIRDMPGKHSMRKDEYLTTIMLVPPKQHISVDPFSSQTRQNSFAVGPDGLRGWNINALIAESPQAKEEKRRRKELRRRQKAALSQLHAQQQQGRLPGAQTPGPPRNPQPPPPPPLLRGLKREMDSPVPPGTDGRDLKKRKLDSHISPHAMPLQQPTPL